MSATLAGLALLAVVAQDQIPLRAAAQENAAINTNLSQGDRLEIRGEKRDYLQVYDHRRERAGFVKANQVRMINLDAQAADSNLAVLRFLRDTPGMEALGIAYAAAYLQGQSGDKIAPDAYLAIGEMAERLARRANRQQKDNNPTSAQIDSAAQYGIKFVNIEREGQIHICYDGQAWRRALEVSKNSAEQIQAVLGSTHSDCIDPRLGFSERLALDQWRADLLDKIDSKDAPEHLKNRLKMRRAGVWASLAYNQARKAALDSRNTSLHAQLLQSANRAGDELAAVNKLELFDEDKQSYEEAALRTAAVRWAVLPPLPNPGGGLQLQTVARAPGETCVNLLDARNKPLHQRCTYSQVWPQSARANSDGSKLVLAVQALPGWLELWVFQRDAQGWHVDVLPPANSNPELGYVEFAGWVPGSNKLLLAREYRSEGGRYKKSFEVFNLDSMQAEIQSERISNAITFQKWQDPQWRKLTLSLR